MSVLFRPSRLVLTSLSSKAPPTARASRSSFAPDGAQTPLLMERRSAPPKGGRAVRGDKRSAARRSFEHR
ncbi:hypothetical protein [Methanoculleus chikugoensis]|uniref:hypothetical protein n=1 Tax=Methanoculleus chikugoensis TaxID=118126 RepID=UPI000AEBF029|nr:hypothetical protein [Methanoculleus chikugoensis]